MVDLRTILLFLYEGVVFRSKNDFTERMIVELSNSAEMLLMFEDLIAFKSQAWKDPAVVDRTL